MPRIERVTTQNAPSVYAARTGRSAEIDAVWGTRFAALAEVKERLVRGVVNLRRAPHAGRVLAEPPPLPAWAAETMASLPAAMPDLLKVDHRFAVAALPAMAEAARLLAAGRPCAEALDALRPVATDLEAELGPAADRELAEIRAKRARNDTARAFFEGTRYWFDRAVQRLPRPHEVMLLAASAGVEPIEPSAAIVRKQWEKRVRRWRDQPPRGPFGHVLVESRR